MTTHTISREQMIEILSGFEPDNLRDFGTRLGDDSGIYDGLSKEKMIALLTRYTPEQLRDVIDSVEIARKRITIRDIMELFISHKFRFILKIILIAYNVILAHAAITHHPIPAANWVVMAGLITAEMSLVSLLLQITMAKIDSKRQEWITVTAIIIITVAVALNAMGGINVINGSESLRFFVAYTNFVSPMLPVVVLLLVFLSDASADSVQRTIKRAISDSEIEGEKQTSRLAIEKSKNVAEMARQTKENEKDVARLEADAEVLELQLMRERAEREKEKSQIEADIQLAQAEAELRVAVAQKAADVRQDVMSEYIESDDFRKKQKANAKRDALAMLDRATSVTGSTNGNRTTGNG